jgi:hypothetical protein
MTFANLRKLLEQLVQNRQMYESYIGLAFRVQLVKKGGQMHFNIEKNKAYKKKDKSSKKYEIAIHNTFGSSSSITDTATPAVLACKLPSHLVEPYFEKSPADLRTLSREQREVGQRIAAQGGEHVKEAFFGERYWKATLFPTADDVFANSGAGQSYNLENVKSPILLLEDPE